MHVGVTSDAGSSGSRLGVSVHVAEVEADYKVHSSVLDGEGKGLNQVEGVEEGSHRSLHQAALRNTITWHLQAKHRPAIALQVESAANAEHTEYQHTC